MESMTLSQSCESFPINNRSSLWPEYTIHAFVFILIHSISHILIFSNSSFALVRQDRSQALTQVACHIREHWCI